MGHKTTQTIALILFVILMTAIIPVGCAVQWSPDMRLTWNDNGDWMSSIAQASDGKIWVVWHSYRTGNAEIFYKVYDPSQVHPWSSDMRLTTDTNTDVQPSIMRAKDGKLWVVWSTNRNGNYDIFYKVYDGVSWSPDTPLITNPKPDEFPSIMQTWDNKLCVAWSTNRTGNYDIYNKTSNDNGSSWSSDTQVTTLTDDDRDPAIMQDSNRVIWVVWMKNDNIFYKTSNNWLSNEAITTNPALDWHPSIMQASDGKIWIVWDSDRSAEQNDLYYRSGYIGSWTPDSNNALTSDGADDDMPSIMRAMDGTIWLVWTSSRLDNYDIYYKTTATLPLHDLSIFSVTPSTTIAYQGKIISIEVVAQNHGTNTETFNITCYVVNLIQLGQNKTTLTAGQLYPITFLWNISTTARGTYTINATASIVQGETNTGDNFMTTTVYVRILGDSNDDGKVDISDLFELGNAYGSDPSKPNWNPNCDFNRDNKVDTSDLNDLNKNYGNS